MWMDTWPAKLLQQCETKCVCLHKQLCTPNTLSSFPACTRERYAPHPSWQFSAESWHTSLMAFGNWSLRCETLSGAIILDVMSNCSLLLFRWQPNHSKNKPCYLKTQLTEPRLACAVRGQTCDIESTFLIYCGIIYSCSTSYYRFFYLFLLMNGGVFNCFDTKCILWPDSNAWSPFSLKLHH